MKTRNWLLVAGVVVGASAAFFLGYCSFDPQDVDTSAADLTEARFDSLAKLHRATTARADSLDGLVAEQASALRATTAHVDSLTTEHVEAVRTVQRLAREATGADGSGGKGEFSLAAFVEARDAAAVGDSLVKALQEQNDLLREQNATLAQQVEVLRAALASSDSLTTAAKRALEASSAARASLETALDRAERQVGVWKGLTFAASGVVLTAGAGFAVCALVAC